MTYKNIQKIILYTLTAAILILIIYSLSAEKNINIMDTPFEQPSVRHWLGTDDIGKDIVSEIAISFRNTVLFILLSLISSIIFGAAVAALHFTEIKSLQFIIERIIDTILSIPIFIFIIIVASFMNNSAFSTAVIIGMLNWGIFTRLLIFKITEIKNSGYYKYSSVSGGKFFYLLKKHIVKESIFYLLPVIMLKTKQLLQAEITLSFIGIFGMEYLSIGSMLKNCIKFSYMNIWTNWIIPLLLSTFILILWINIINNIYGYTLEDNNAE